VLAAETGFERSRESDVRSIDVQASQEDQFQGKVSRAGRDGQLKAFISMPIDEKRGSIAPNLEPNPTKGSTPTETGHPTSKTAPDGTRNSPSPCRAGAGYRLPSRPPDDWKGAQLRRSQPIRALLLSASPLF